MRSSILALLAIMSVPQVAGAAPAIPRTVAAAVADPGRPETDRAADANRNAAETLAFAGVRTGTIVAELGSGRGYYTRLLAKAVGPKGKVLAVVSATQAARPGGVERDRRGLSERDHRADAHLPDPYVFSPGVW